MSQVTPAGFLRTRLDERLAELQVAYRAIYGNEISIEPDDLDGQFLGIMAERIADVEELAEDVYNALNPDLATGAALSRIAIINGVSALVGSFSTADVQLLGIPGTSVPEGSLIRSNLDNSTWVLTATLTFSDLGTASGSVVAAVKGVQPAPAGSLTLIGSPAYGWQSVTNATAAIPGSATETDEQLRIRRRRSTSLPAQTILDGMYAAIGALAGVRVHAVYENFTGTVNANGQAAHSIYAIVEGGDSNAIANTIWIRKTQGAEMVGALTIEIMDSQGRPHTVRFDRPAYTDVYITVNVTKRPGYPGDGAARIKAALVTHGLNLQIGEPLLNSRLYSPVNSVPNHFVTAIFTGTAPAPTLENNITIPYNGLARIDTSRIVVNEV